jgi:hypothetical protein
MITKGAEMAKTNASQWFKASMKDWHDSEARQSGAPLPSGDYEGVVEDLVIKPSKNGKMGALWTLTVTEGKFRGNSAFKWQGLEETPKRSRADKIGEFKGDIEALDCPFPDKPKSLDEVGEALNEVVGVELLFTVEQRDEFTNIYIREALEGGEPRGNGKDVGDGDGENDQPDWAAIGKTADEGDGPSIDALTAEAEARNIEPNDYDTWAELADEFVD